MSTSPSSDPSSPDSGRSRFARAWNWIQRRREGGRQSDIYQTQIEMGRDYLGRGRALDEELLTLRNDHDSRGAPAIDPSRAELETHGHNDVQQLVDATNRLTTLIAEHRRPENQNATWWAANRQRYIEFRNVTFPDAVSRIGALPHWGRRVRSADASSPTVPRALQQSLATLQSLINETTGDFPGIDDLDGFLTSVESIVDGMEASILERPTSATDDAPNIVRPPNGQLFIDWAREENALLQELNALELFNRADLRGTDAETVAHLAEQLAARIRRSIHPVDRAAPGTVSVENLDEVSAELGRLLLQIQRHLTRPLPENTTLNAHAEQANAAMRRTRNRLLMILGTAGLLGVGYAMLPSSQEDEKAGKPAPIVKPKNPDPAVPVKPGGKDMPIPLPDCSMKRVGADIKTTIPKNMVGSFIYDIARPSEKPIRVILRQDTHSIRLPDDWVAATDVTITIYYQKDGGWFKLDPITLPKQ